MGMGLGWQRGNMCHCLEWKLGDWLSCICNEFAYAKKILTPPPLIRGGFIDPCFPTMGRHLMIWAFGMRAEISQLLTLGCPRFVDCISSSMRSSVGEWMSEGKHLTYPGVSWTYTLMGWMKQNKRCSVPKTNQTLTLSANSRRPELNLYALFFTHIQHISIMIFYSSLIILSFANIEAKYPLSIQILSGYLTSGHMCFWYCYLAVGRHLMTFYDKQWLH